MQNQANRSGYFMRNGLAGLLILTMVSCGSDDSNSPLESVDSDADRGQLSLLGGIELGLKDESGRVIKANLNNEDTIDLLEVEQFQFYAHSDQAFTWVQFQFGEGGERSRDWSAPFVHGRDNGGVPHRMFNVNDREQITLKVSARVKGQSTTQTETFVLNFVYGTPFHVWSRDFESGDLDGFKKNSKTNHGLKVVDNPSGLGEVARFELRKSDPTYEKKHRSEATPQP